MLILLKILFLIVGTCCCAMLSNVHDQNPEPSVFTLSYISLTVSLIKQLPMYANV